MITVTNELTCGKVEFLNENYKLSGDFKVEPKTGKINTLNLSIFGDTNIGNVSASMENGTLKFSYNRIDQSNVERVVASVNSIVTELEAKYKPITK